MHEKVKWLHGLCTDTGTVRKENQDHIALLLPDGSRGTPRALAMMADGMGGHTGGSMASGLAIQLMTEWWNKGPAKDRGYKFVPEQMRTQVMGVFHDINQRLVDFGNLHDQSGTTLSVLFLYDWQYYVYHVGDSRIYRLRTGLGRAGLQVQRPVEDDDTGPLNGTRTLSLSCPLWQLTEDQSWVGQQVKNGLMTWEEARVHPRRNLLMNCLGVDESLNIFYECGSYDPGDLFMLCSDGYHGMFSDVEITHHLQLALNIPQDFQKASWSMVAEALHQGSQDNVSVVLLQKRQEERSGWSRILSLFEKRS